MTEFDEIMEQHEQKGKKALQMIVQDEMSKMDETFENLSSQDPVIKAVHHYMENKGLALLMQGGKINNDQLAVKLGFPVELVRKAMLTYSLHLRQVFRKAENRFHGKAPWKKYEKSQPGRG